MMPPSPLTDEEYGSHFNRLAVQRVKPFAQPDLVDASQGKNGLIVAELLVKYACLCLVSGKFDSRLVDKGILAHKRISACVAPAFIHQVEKAVGRIYDGQVARMRRLESQPERIA